MLEGKKAGTGVLGLKGGVLRDSSHPRETGVATVETAEKDLTHEDLLL